MLEWTWIDRGGPLMLPIVLLSLVGFILFFERLFFLHKGQIKTVQFLEGIKNLLDKKRLLEALTVCEETLSPVAVIAKVALLNHDQPRDIVQTRLQAAALVEIPTLERRIATIGAIAKVAPLLGFLGTILALYQGFNVMHADGPYAQAASFSGLVASALLTTAAGLIIAILGHLGHHFLHGRVRAIVHDMEYVANDMMGLFDEGVFEGLAEK